ncbi:MAG: phosphoribosylglycinamide formyltransferase [Parvularculales bacterium]
MTGQQKHIPTGILISGRGSNMAALAKATFDSTYPAKIALVVSDRPDASGLEWAKTHGLTTQVIDHKGYVSRESFEEALTTTLEDAGVEILCNAGFMRLLTTSFVNRWHDRHLNIHPSLLPSFRGLHVHERVLKTGVCLTGCTVHYVRTEMDAGPIIAQAAVPVSPDDTSDSLAARVLKAEHKIYPLALKLVIEGRAPVIDGRVQLHDVTLPPTFLTVPQ